MLREDATYAYSHINGMFRDLEIKIIGKERIKLNAQHTSLCQQRSMTFYIGEEIFRSLHSREHYSLAHHCSHLCAANVEHVAMFSQE